MAYVNQTTRAHASIAERLTAFFEEFRADRQKARVYRTTMRELDQLTNRELVDLGLTRNELHSVAMQAAYGK